MEMRTGQRTGGVLENYLNDMKKNVTSRRNVPAKPSTFSQRMNDERVKLPSERNTDRRFERVNAETIASCRSLAGTNLASNSESFSTVEQVLGGSRPESARIRRSFSCDPRIQRSIVQGEISQREDNYGFARKREVTGGWTKSRGTEGLLHHSAGHNDPQPVGTPRRCERLERKADERFTEMVAHMKAKNPEQRSHFESFKTRSECSIGLIHHDSRPMTAR